KKGSVMMFVKVDTKHVKRAEKDVPTKADNKHEYIRVFCWSKILRSDGTLSKDLYKFTLYPKCVECGAVKIRHARNVTEVEVSLTEYKGLLKTMKETS